MKEKEPHFSYRIEEAKLELERLKWQFGILRVLARLLEVLLLSMYLFWGY